MISFRHLFTKKTLPSDGSMVTDPCLRVNGLSKSIDKKHIVRNVTFSVAPGEILGFLGPNGAGKTTCFYMITGTLAADSGRISFQGYDITHFPVYQRARLGLGYLPQDSSVFNALSVYDNIYAIAEFYQRNAKKCDAFVRQLLMEFDITHLSSVIAKKLSGGERRRVEIARSLAARPSFILLDEPFAGVDPLSTADIKKLICHLRDIGLGVLITDHNVQTILDIADNVIVFYDGAVLCQGSPTDIVNDSKVRQTYLGNHFQPPVLSDPSS